MTKKILFLLCATFFFGIIKGQDSVNPVAKGFKYNFTEDGKYSMKLGFGTQIWARYTQQNPNTFDWNGKNVDEHFDFLIRRTFFKYHANLDRLFIFSLLGIKSQTQLEGYAPFINGKPQLFFYDLFINYSFFERHLYIGYGLHLYHGLSRYASASSIGTISPDVSFLSAPNVFTTEQLARNLGLFIDGLAGSFSYRFVLATPFITDSKNMPKFNTNKAADIATKTMKYEAYIGWQFLDKEIKPVPYSTGTYLGKKKILNIGTGFKYHPKSTASLNNNGDTIFHDQLHLAADLFMELPFKNKNVFTLYTCYYLFNYGPNYLFSGGYGNTFKANSPRGAGNSEPLLGTGSAVTTTIAWLFPLKIGKNGALQPYYEGNYRFFEALNNSSINHNIGLNYYILGHNAKITLQYSLRPYFENIGFNSYKNQVILKFQITI